MKKRVNFTIDEETLKVFDLLVNKRHTTRSQYITDIVWNDYKFKQNSEQKLLVNQEGYRKP